MHRRAALALVAAIASTAPAHEFWIQPDAYRVAPGALVTVSLLHGERFAGDVVRRDETMIERFDLLMLDGDGALGAPGEVVGMHRHDRSFVRPASAGRGVLVYESSEYLNVLPAERFEAYLREEGLGRISAWRAEMGESGVTGREAYVRCAKALVSIDEDGAEPRHGPMDAPVGLDCEIVLLSAEGEGVAASESEASRTTLTIQVLFEGEALEGARVVAVGAADHENLIELTTDESGRATLSTESGGAWMFTTLHMTRTEGREDVEWKSYWASLTLSVGR